MIFTDTKQRLRFALTFTQLSPDITSLPGRVMVTINEVKATPSLGQSLMATPEKLAQDAHEVVTETLALQKHEKSALVALYSPNWELRRIAANELRDHYRPLLSRTIDDRHLLEKLVARHYIADRQRGTSWALRSMAHEFGIEYERLVKAADTLAEHAKALEHAALQSLEARLRLLESQPA